MNSNKPRTYVIIDTHPEGSNAVLTSPMEIKDFVAWRESPYSYLDLDRLAVGQMKVDRLNPNRAVKRIS